MESLVVRRWILWSCLLIASCGFKRTSSLKAVRYNAVSEYVLDDLEIRKNDSYTDLFLFRDMTIYLTSEYFRGDKTAKTVYHIVESNQSQGLMYVEEDLKPKIFELEEFLENINLGRGNIDAFNNDWDGTVKIDTLRPDLNKVIYRYLAPRDDKTGNDSVYKYFDKKLSSHPFSLSPSLDKRMKSKFFKLELVVNPRTKIVEGKKYEIPKLKWTYQWTPVEVEDKEKYMRLFDRFRKDKKNFDLR